jgi:peptidoglycan/xylan/chitin deacetylase (PgdA/CDA1 family)
MVRWLDPVAAALDSAPAAVPVFFRDDDAGWRDDRLMRLLDVVAPRGVPVDVAAIPVEVGVWLAAELRGRAEGGLVGVHQHGYAHENHEPEGRRCEFGPSRSRGDQRHDIAAGRELLEAMLGPALQPWFTPPWNRCTAQTGEVLLELGFTALSRDRTAGRLGLPGLAELPIDVDWFATRRGRPLGRDAVGAQLAAVVQTGGPVGLMLHHAEMDDAEMLAFSGLIDLVASHPHVRCRAMAAVLATTAQEARA